MQNYDSLLDEDPDIQECIARAKIETQQGAVLVVVKARFPSLAEEAQQVIERLDSLNDLGLLAKEMSLAPDEAITRRLLSVYARHAKQ